MSDTTRHGWWAFSAVNEQARYGFGSESDADLYADHLNLDRSFNVYAVEFVGEEDEDLAVYTGSDLDLDDGFDLDEELACIEESTV